MKITTFLWSPVAILVVFALIAHASAIAQILVPVTVLVKPDGAEVRVNGEPIGSTPARLRLAADRPVEIRVSRPGYRPMVKDNFKPLQTGANILEGRLVLLHPGVVVKGIPGTAVEFEGPVGQGFSKLGVIDADGALRLPDGVVPGRYRFLFSRPDCLSVEKVVTIPSNATTVMELEAPAIPAAPATIDVISIPPADEMRLGGKVVTPDGNLLSIAAGEKSVLVARAEGYGDETIEIPALKPSQVHRVEIVFKDNSGTLKFDVADETEQALDAEFFVDAVVLVDGRVLPFEAPGVIPRVTAGPRKVAIQHPHYTVSGPNQVDVVPAKVNASKWRAVLKRPYLALVIRDEKGLPVTAQLSVKEGRPVRGQDENGIFLDSYVKTTLVVSADGFQTQELSLGEMVPGESQSRTVVLKVDLGAEMRAKLAASEDAYRKREASLLKLLQGRKEIADKIIAAKQKISRENAANVENDLADLERKYSDVIGGNAEIKGLISELRVFMRKYSD